MAKHILITGGLGFIGINLTLRLLEDPSHHITIVDNLTYGSRASILKKCGLEKHERVKIFYMDICDPSFQDLFMKEEYIPIQEIYHLAAIASPIWYKIYPLETLDVSYIGTKNVFEIAKKYNARVMICSSSEVYGDAQISPQSESYFGNTNSYGERACYDEGKRIMEALAYTYQKKFDMRIHIIRIFNTYGPFMNIEDGRVIPSFIKSYLHGKPVKIFNGGKQTRAFNYIDDTLDGMIALMKSDVYKPMNIGNDQEISICDFYEIFRKVIEEDFPHLRKCGDEMIEYGFSDADDPKVRKPDLTEAMNHLNYRVKHSLEYGLNRTIQYFIDYMV